MTNAMTPITQNKPTTAITMKTQIGNPSSTTT
jgi:hypothetical protein